MVAEFSERRELYVPRDLVFDAWSEADNLSAWYVPGDALLERLELEPVAGGSWNVAWRAADGVRLAEVGTFAALARPERMAWKLRLSGQDAVDCDTQVDLRLADLGGACRIELSHTGLSDPQWRRRYASLWPARIEALTEFFSAI